MTDKEKGSPESVAVRLGAGAKENVFIDYNTEGYDVGVDLKGEGDNGPTGNKFIGGGAKRRQMPEVQAKNDPWYRQIGFQIAAGLAVAAIVGIWTWLW